MRRLDEPHQAPRRPTPETHYVIADASRTLPRASRTGARLVEQILAALDTQTVIVPGTAAAKTVSGTRDT